MILVEIDTGGRRTGVAPDAGRTARGRGGRPRARRSSASSPMAATAIAGPEARAGGRRRRGPHGLTAAAESLRADRHRAGRRQRRLDADGLGSARGAVTEERPGDVRVRRSAAGRARLDRAGRCRGRGRRARGERATPEARRFVIDAGAKILAKDVAPYLAGPRRDPGARRRRSCAASTTTTGSSSAPPGAPLPEVGASSPSCRTTSARSSTCSMRSSSRRTASSSTAGRSTPGAATAESPSSERRARCVDVRLGRGSPRSLEPARRRSARSERQRTRCSRTTGRRRPAARRPAVEDEVDRVAELLDDRRRRRVASGRPETLAEVDRQRPEVARQGARGVRGRGRAGRSCSAPPVSTAGQRTSGRCGTTSVSPPGHAAAASAAAAGVITPARAAWAASSSSSTIPLSGGRRLTCEQALDAARRGHGDGDAVDRVGRERDDPAAAAGPRSAAPDRPRRRGPRGPSRATPRAIGMRSSRSAFAADRAPARRARAPRSSARRPRPRAAAPRSGRRPGPRPARSASPSRGRPRRSSRGRSTGRRSQAWRRAGSAAAVPASRMARPLDTPGATNSRKRGWRDRDLGDAGELRPGVGGRPRPAAAAPPTARIFVTGWSIAVEQVWHELGAGPHERRVVVGTRVVGPQDEPLEVVDVGVEATIARPGQDPAGGRGSERRVQQELARVARESGRRHGPDQSALVADERVGQAQLAREPHRRATTMRPVTSETATPRSRAAETAVDRAPRQVVVVADDRPVDVERDEPDREDRVGRDRHGRRQERRALRRKRQGVVRRRTATRGRPARSGHDVAGPARQPLLHQIDDDGALVRADLEQRHALVGDGPSAAGRAVAPITASPSGPPSRASRARTTARDRQARRIDLVGPDVRQVGDDHVERPPIARPAAAGRPRRTRVGRRPRGRRRSRGPGRARPARRRSR